MRYHNIQVVRLAAAVGVVLAHLGYYAGHQFGAAGFPADRLYDPAWYGLLVPTFFAVSGFVLTQAVRSAPPGRFLLARAVRVYPGYWAAAALVMGLMWFTVWPPEFAAHVRPGNVGWMLLPRGPGGAIYPLGVEWTLVYEVVLYLWLAAAAWTVGPGRGLTAAAGVWAALLLVKAAVRPGYGTAPLPTWGTFPFSAANLPFLLGVLAYAARDRGRRWRWVVLAGAAGWVVWVPGRPATLEGQWLAFTPPAVALVWFAAQVRQLPGSHPLVAAGEYTYGVYLIHAPVMTGVFYLLAARGWLVGTAAGVYLAGAAALTAGFLFGWAECRMHARLRPLARWNPDLRGPLRRAWARMWSRGRPVGRG